MASSRFLRRLAAGAAFAATAALATGCVNETALDQLSETRPTGSAFSQALFQDYKALARSFGTVGAAAGVAFDRGGSIEMTKMDSTVGALANAYAEKALLAARGSMVEPEPGVDVPTHKMRDRLVRALERGKDAFPADAARAQAEYDCWMMNASIAQMKAASEKCRASLDASLAKLEAEAKPAAAPAPPAPQSPDSEKPAVQP
jgi:OOP family OmpA-OmpF porin